MVNRSITSFVNSVVFFVLNFVGNLLLRKIDEIKIQDKRIIGFKKEYLGDLIEMWNLEFKFSEFKFSRRDKYILYFFGNKICYLMIDNNGRLLGFMYFYFNWRDLVNRRIHSALAYMSPDCRGKGLGSVLHDNVFSSIFKNRWVRGISARWSSCNEAVSRILSKFGFEVVEKYLDKTTGEKRLYGIYKKRDDRIII